MADPIPIRRDPDQVARDAARLFEATSDCYSKAVGAAALHDGGEIVAAAESAEVANAIAGELLAVSLVEAGAITRPRARAIGAGYWINRAGRVVSMGSPPKGGA